MTRVLWLVPDKPDNISTGRQRIAQGLRDCGHDVTVTQDRRRHARLQASGEYDVLLASSAAGGLFGPLARTQGMAFVVDHVDPVHQQYDAGGRRSGMLVQGLLRVAFRAADGILYVYDEERERVDGNGATVLGTSLGLGFGAYLTKHRFACPVPRAGTGTDPFVNVTQACGDVLGAANGMILASAVGGSVAFMCGLGVMVYIKREQLGEGDA